MELRLWIPIVRGIPDALSSVPDSKAQNSVFHEYDFSGLQFSIHKQKFLGIQNSDTLTFLHRAPIAPSSRDHSWNLFFFFNAPWLSLLGSWTRYLWGKVSANWCGSKSSWVFGNCGNRLPASAMFFCSPSQLWGATRKTTKTASILRRRTDPIPAATNKFCNWEQMGVQASEIWLKLVRFPGTIFKCWGSRCRFLEH